MWVPKQRCSSFSSATARNIESSCRTVARRCCTLSGRSLTRRVLPSSQVLRQSDRASSASVHSPFNKCSEESGSKDRQSSNSGRPRDVFPTMTCDSAYTKRHIRLARIIRPDEHSQRLQVHRALRDRPEVPSPRFWSSSSSRLTRQRGRRSTRRPLRVCLKSGHIIPGYTGVGDDVNLPHELTSISQRSQ